MIKNATQFISNKTTADEIVKALEPGKKGLVQFFGEINSSNIKSYSIVDGSTSTASTATFTASPLIVKGAFNLSVCIEFENPQPSIGAKADSMNFSKEFNFGFENTATTSAANLVIKLNDIAKRIGASEFLAFSVSSTNIVCTVVKKELGDVICADIKSVKLVDLDNAVTAQPIPQPIYSSLAVTYVGHSAPYGTYGYLTRNLKFPTTANTDFLAELSDGTPNRGTTYSQLIIKVSEDRGPIGDSKFGENITSCFDWVLWFPSSLKSGVSANMTSITTQPVVSE